MNAKLAWGIAAWTLWPLLAGCGSSPGIVRGQNPAEFATYAANPVQTVVSPPSVAYGWHEGWPATTQHPIPAMQPIHAAAPLQHVLSHGNNHAGAGKGHHPTHYHWFSYEQPRDLVYPPANQPGAVVQYPYYTVKGPTDFFME